MAITPMPSLEASVSIINSYVKSGICKTGVVTMACFNVSMVELAAEVHSKESFRKRSVNGAAIVA